MKKIDRFYLKNISSHSRKMSFKNAVKGLSYERCAELPYIATMLEPLFKEKMRYLDIGSGKSIFPTFLLKETGWDITCIDKHSWVARQNEYAKRVYGDDSYQKRFHVIEKDFLQAEMQLNSFDIITNISVIEHFESDSLAVEKSAKLLKNGGIYILTTPVNDKHYKEFFLKKNVYGKEFANKPVFYQRHYDLKSIQERIVAPSNLKERERIYFGEYNFRYFENILDIPWPLKPIKILYQWANPFFARKFITYREYPVSRKNMKMYTSCGIIIVLEK